jgi:hypothetical protein
MTNHRKRAFIPTENRGLNIESIISAPLVAAASANAMMLKEQTKFLMDFCFTKKDGDLYDPVLIEMSVTKAVLEPGENAGDNPTIRKIQTYFKLPLLTIIPINSLAVDNVTVDFNMEIISQTLVDSDSGKTNSAIWGPSDEKTQLKGKISYDSKEQNNKSTKSERKSQNSSKLTVHVNASPLPLPIGISTILDLYVRSIFPSTQNELTQPEDNKDNQ